MVEVLSFGSNSMKKQAKKHLYNRKILFILVPLFLFLLVFFRLYNLDQTARFTQDESSDLVRMHQYYEAKKITLVGPISNNNAKVFGSLTYYQLMPFTAAGNFEPISPVYGMVFWGALTAILLILITLKINKKLLPYVAVLVIIWYPLLETSRWAWNPHLMLFWIALGIWLYLKDKPWSYALSGLALGLAFHNHYIAFITTAIFVLLAIGKLLKQRKIKLASLFAGGFTTAFIPFVIFDLRHPPGLFFSKYLMSGSIENTKETTFIQVLADIWNNLANFGFYIAQNELLAILLGILVIGVVAFDMRSNRKALLYLIPVVGQIIAGSFMDSIQTRYILPAVVFFLVWLLIPRKMYAEFFARTSFIALIVGALFSVYTQLHHIPVYPDIKTIMAADKIIAETIQKNKVKDANFAVLASPASDTLGVSQRNALQVRDIHFLAANQYDVSDSLFVLSISDENRLRKDESQPMQPFKDTTLNGVYPVDKSQWKVYWFKKQ